MLVTQRWLVGGVVWIAATAADAAPYVRGTGLSFPHPFVNLAAPLELVGQLDRESKAPFPLDPNREYTWSLYGAVIHEIQEPAPGIRYFDLTFGVLEIREDLSPNANFLENPPNAVVPSTFRDGSIVLLGSVTDFRIREIFAILTATADVSFESGNAAGMLAETEWGFAAAVSIKGDDVPAGYSAHWAIEMSPIAPVSVRETSWAGVKMLYR